jgi:hypothetical protein
VEGDGAHHPLDNVIDVHIARASGARSTLDQPGQASSTVRGVGFMVREGEP